MFAGSFIKTEGDGETPGSLVIVLAFCPPGAVQSSFFASVGVASLSGGKGRGVARLSVIDPQSLSAAVIGLMIGESQLCIRSVESSTRRVTGTLAGSGFTCSCRTGRYPDPISGVDILLERLDTEAFVECVLAEPVYRCL